MPYELFYAQQFHEQLMELPDSAYDKVEHSIGVLAYNRGLLREYRPPYEADYPPVECEWYFIPNSYKVLYVTVDDDVQQMRFLFISDTREDPRHRFDHMIYDPQQPQ